MAVDTKFGRLYVSVNPNPNTGPITWRVAVNDSISGGGGSGNYDFDGVDPIEVIHTPGVDPAPDTVVTSLDFEQLDSRE